MASTYTLNLGLRKPEHRDPETVESWDGVINNNLDIIDVAVGDRTYSEHNYIHNSEALSISLNNLDIALKDVSDSIPAITAPQFAALFGPGAYPPTGANPYATINYVRISRKEVLSPEYVGAVLSPTPAVPNVGTMTSSSDLIISGGLAYRYNYYKWVSSVLTPLQKYDIMVQWQVPSTFLGFNTTPGKALILDIRTDSAVAADCCVDIELHKDRMAYAAPTVYTWPVPAVTASDVWQGEKQGPVVIGVSSTDLAPLGLLPGDVLNIRITMSSLANHVVKVGAITIQGTW